MTTGSYPATGGGKPVRVLSAATTNPTSVKSTSGTISGLLASNVTATPYYLKIYDLPAAPNVGTDIPVLTIPIPAGGTAPLPGAIAFFKGIALAITGGMADADTSNAAVGVAVNMIVY